jgi:hypothetical protein
MVLAASETDGVLLGRWRQDLDRRECRVLDLTVLALSLSPQFATDRLGFAGTASGLYRTRNGARSWRAVETDVPEPLSSARDLAELRRGPPILAGTEADGLCGPTTPPDLASAAEPGRPGDHGRDMTWAFSRATCHGGRTSIAGPTVARGTGDPGVGRA